eukprot:7296895-Ditylum_brightwellii.AAC.1
MRLADVQCNALNREDLVSEEDFINFKKTKLETVFRNSRARISGVLGISTIAEIINANGAVIQAAVPTIPGI